MRYLRLMGLGMLVTWTGCKEATDRSSAPAAPSPPRAPVIQALPSPPPRTGFGGRWAGACSLTVKCAGETSVDEDQLDVTITDKGASLEVHRDGCLYLFDVRGKQATMRPGQRCPTAETGAVESWTLTFDAERRELASTLVTRPEAAGERCTARARGQLAPR